MRKLRARNIKMIKRAVWPVPLLVRVLEKGKVGSLFVVHVFEVPSTYKPPKEDVK